MDLGDPTRSITPTLDGPVLAVLARSGRPLTVGEVAAETVRGSEIGVRRCLARLVDQGLVQATEMGRNRVHELNREHVAAPIATTMADLRTELWRRMRKELSGWKPKPLYACAFGSAAVVTAKSTATWTCCWCTHRSPVKPDLGERRTSSTQWPPSGPLRWLLPLLRPHGGLSTSTSCVPTRCFGVAIHFKLWISPLPNGWTGLGRLP